MSTAASMAMHRSYSHTSFANNWCQKHWWKLYNFGNNETYKECFDRYKDPTTEYMEHRHLHKFIVHYIAAVPELTDIKFELNDNPTFECIVEGIAKDLMDELLHNINRDANITHFKESQFINSIISELGNCQYLKKKNPNKKIIKYPTTKLSERLNSNIVHDDIVSFRQVFEDVLILYPIGKMLKTQKARICAEIIETMSISKEHRTKAQIARIIEWIWPALRAHKIPIHSVAAHRIAQALTLRHYSEQSVIFLCGSPSTTFFIVLYGSVAVLNGSLCAGEHVFTLQSGSGFGGLALASDEAQSNSTLASTDSLIAELSAADYMKFMQSSYERNANEKYVVLKRCMLLKTTPLHLLKELSLFAITKYFDRNSVILQQGNVYDDGVYFIKCGTLKVVRELRQNVFVNVDKLGIAESFNWESLLTAFQSLSSIIAESKCVLYLIPKTHILHKLDSQSLKQIFLKISAFPSDLEFADNLQQSLKWTKYRKSLFRQVRGCRTFKTHRIIDKDRGALTMSSDLHGFPFKICEKLDVEIEKKEKRKKTKSESAKNGKMGDCQINVS